MNALLRIVHWLKTSRRTRRLTLTRDWGPPADRAAGSKGAVAEAQSAPCGFHHDLQMELRRYGQVTAERALLRNRAGHVTLRA